MSSADRDRPSGARLARAAGRHVFGTDVGGYHSARLGYPDALYDLVLQGGARTIAEVGAGTGLATERLLAAEPARLVAIEPDAALAGYLRERFAGTVVEVVEAGFVEAPLSGRFDLVAAASCFHWLDPQAALARVGGLLGPGGRFAMWWNVYRQSGIGDAFAEAVMPLLAGFELPPSEGVAGHYALDAPLHRRTLEDAGLALVASEVFRRDRVLDATQARALYASYSFVRALDPDRRDRLLDAIGQLVDRRFAGAAPNIVLTPAYVATAA